MLEHTVCFSGVSRKEHHLRSEGKGKYIHQAPPLCFSGCLSFHPHGSFIRFYRQEKWACQGHRAGKGGMNLNTFHFTLCFPTCFLWFLLHRTWAYVLSLCCFYSCLQRHVRTRMKKNNPLVLLWPPVVIMWLGVLVKALVRICVPLTCPASFFPRVIYPSHWNLTTTEVSFSHKEMIKKPKLGLSLKAKWSRSFQILMNCNFPNIGEQTGCTGITQREFLRYNIPDSTPGRD